MSTSGLKTFECNNKKTQMADTWTRARPLTQMGLSVSLSASLNVKRTVLFSYQRKEPTLFTDTFQSRFLAVKQA
jgi:hypothetical protein